MSCKNALITVVIPSWKRSAILREILISLEREFSKLMYQGEVLVVGSTGDDDSELVVRNYQSGSSYMVVSYLKANNNISEKRNVGIKCASGAYLIFLDDDCVPCEGFLKSHLLALEQNPHKTLVCGLVKYDFCSKLISKSYIKYKVGRHNKTNNQCGKYITDATKIVTMNMAVVAKDLREESFFFQQDISKYGLEDYDFAKRALILGFQIYVGKATIFHREENNNFLTFSNKIKEIGSHSSQMLAASVRYEIKNLPFRKIEDSVTLKVAGILLGKCLLERLRIAFSKLFDILPAVPLLFVRILIIISYLDGRASRIQDGR